jgi:pilus assembly protein CpaE
MYETPFGQPARRATLLVALGQAEQASVVAELRSAGFAVMEAHSPTDLSAVAASPEPISLAIVDLSIEAQVMLAAVAELRRLRGAFPALFVASPEEFDAVHEAGIGAADEIALRPLTADSIRWRVEAMVIRASADETSGEVDSALAGEALHQLNAGSPILAVFNPKGGVGKTTIATNLGAVLQVRKGRRVLLVDADIVTGHVALSLGIKHVRGIADTWGADLVTDGRDPLLNLASEHTSGVRVATLTADPLAIPQLDPERFADTLLQARGDVDTLIVDLHPSYSDLNLAILATATRILVPVTPDLPAIRAAVQLTRVASDLGIRDRLSVVVNHINSGFSVGEIESATGMRSVGELRSGGPLLVRAGNVGKTLVEQFPREKLTADFDHVAERVMALVGAGAAAHTRLPERARGMSALLGSKASAG